MLPEHPELGRLQRWMQEVVVHQGTIDEAVASPEAEREIPQDPLADVVLPSHSLSPAERIGVYHGMYLMRIEEALATDYPVIKHYLGDED
ncbi:MAG: putative DNA-binding domain-containing protein, partial [Deltaproteobacteria bacterium]|nr:putative DNA-binding domain-containing protein [Deltaproteobacteria bacterium]